MCWGAHRPNPNPNPGREIDKINAIEVTELQEFPKTTRPWGRYDLPLWVTHEASNAGSLSPSPTPLGVYARTVTFDPEPAVTAIQPTSERMTSEALFCHPVPVMVKSHDLSFGKAAIRSLFPWGTWMNRKKNDKGELLWGERNPTIHKSLRIF